MNPETTLSALGEPNRFRIVELLRTGPRSVNDIRGRLGLRQSQLSQHLTVLKAAGLVERSRARSSGSTNYACSL
jgi:DNA-binding transcriptional ArsR family regulator